MGSGAPSSGDSSDRLAARALDALLETFVGSASMVTGDPSQRLLLTRSGSEPLDSHVRAPRDQAFVLGPVLGTGGMGQVHLAEQPSLGRQVAVKRLRPDVRGEEPRQSLLQEAYVSGSLEHPNIVPIYDLVQSETGDPLVVMKRIEGVSWAQCLVDRSLLPGSSPDDDPLTPHLEILLQVCNAVQFAHSKRIVHRDLKPSNVMIGSFGEVYLLDWGLAVSCDEADAAGRFPRARDLQEIAGTPCYMAPEMITSVHAIDERTDVYLLGGLLHEIVTGRPRHQGKDVNEVLTRACQSKPFEYEPGVPAELGAICNRATHLEREQRFPSAEAFRNAIREFLRHRSSIQLASDAARHLERLIAALAEQSEDASVSRTSLDGSGPAADVRNLFGASRFGFQQALRIWPENEPAVRGLHRAIELMIGFELSQENLTAAVALLGELPRAPDGQLAAEVVALRETIATRRREIEVLRRREAELDLRRGNGPRSIAALLIGIVVFGHMLVLYLLERKGLFVWNRGTVVPHSVGTLVLIGATLVVFRKMFLLNLANRRVAYALMLHSGAALIFRTAAIASGVPIPIALSLEYMIWALGLAGMAVISQRKLLPSAAFMASGTLGVFWPAHASLVLGAAALAALLWISYVWWPTQTGTTGSEEA
ncbi:MAG TPA: serine/threonine-protein kinase [Kofleriaceae bacterium]|nr:serine/threonine-protein kinase [Kofleriaceae bacterium]